MELEEQAQGSRNRHKGWNLRNRREGQSYVYPVRPCRMPVLYARTVCPCSMPVLYVCALCLWSMFVPSGAHTGVHAVWRHYASWRHHSLSIVGASLPVKLLLQRASQSYSNVPPCPPPCPPPRSSPTQTQKQTQIQTQLQKQT